MSKIIKKVTLLWGLPASGKTTYAESFTQKTSRWSRPDAIVIDVDRLSKHYQDTSLVKKIAEEVMINLHYNDHVIVDGLITTNSQAAELLKAIKLANKEQHKNVSFEIVWWSKNVYACLHNDRGRRHLDSTISIQNIPFEQPSSKLLAEFNIDKTNCVRKKVVRKPAFKVWAMETGLGDTDKLYSDNWCLGGTWGNCWGDKGEVYPSTPPTSFEEFDNLLEKTCPSINFLQYKKLYNATVSIENYTEGDYYGGSVGYAKYVCDLNKLYEMLKNIGAV